MLATITEHALRGAPRHLQYPGTVARILHAEAERCHAGWAWDLRRLAKAYNLENPEFVFLALAPCFDPLGVKI